MYVPTLAGDETGQIYSPGKDAMGMISPSSRHLTGLSLRRHVWTVARDRDFPAIRWKDEWGYWWGILSGETAWTLWLQENWSDNYVRAMEGAVVQVSVDKR